MTVLCIETSTSVCSAAICKEGKPLKQCICLEGSNHARLLPLYIEELLRFAKQEGLTIEAVALSEGPGSYTGLRIGTSTAKGLCYGLNVPLIPVPTLHVLIEAAKEKLEESGIKNQESGIFIPLIDARRMEVYTTDPSGNARAVVVENEESLSFDSGAVYYFGDGAAKCQALFTSPNWHYIPDIVPEARFVGVLAEKMTNDKCQMTNAKSVDLAYYEPYYLKQFVAAQSHVKGLK